MITTDKKPPILSLEVLTGTSYLSSHNAAYLEALFEQYQQDTHTLSSQWTSCLSQLTNEGQLSHADVIQTNFSVVAQRPSNFQTESETQFKPSHSSLNDLINAFRRYGHLISNLDPLNLKEKPVIPELNFKTYGFTEQDLESIHHLNGMLGLQSATLAEVLARLHAMYCNSLGIEFDYILDAAQKQWLIERIENSQDALSPESKKRILHRLLESEGLEKHLGTQFVGQKRFSIEGGDSLMPLLDTVARHSSQHGIQSLVLGMGHRGRLNVLINFMGKSPSQLFEEFVGNYQESDISGDVKYHKGFKSLLRTEHGQLQVSLAYNPSHLEFVDAVVEGIARAEQDQRMDEGSQVASQEVLPILMHGDAAFAGQGIVMETLQLSQTQAYGTGGTLHIISNNQVGFTTDPVKARSSRYCSDIAKMIEAPVFHVNGNDPEAVCWAAQMALEFRMRFQKDVVIDLVCYRRYGHNEADEPAATQPKMYEVIRDKSFLTVSQVYAKRLESEKIIESGEAERWLKEYRDRVKNGNPVASLLEKQLTHVSNTMVQSDWRHADFGSISDAQLKSFAKRLTALPQGMKLQLQVDNVIKNRSSMMEGKMPLNWGAAEILAYASLLSEDINIRLTGQDCERGTFSHRHAVLHYNTTGELAHTPLLEFTKRPKQLTLYNSILSEAAVMGFEYGYACTRLQSLVIWEAQFGDFFNGAQVIVDQFLSSSEQKWGQSCGLVLLLPHGFEGQGPEHSSARLERFLQLCAQENMQVCVPTTPAQQYHLLRRQALRRDYQKPLIVMTPKSLLRHEAATSSLSELSEGKFQPVIPWNGGNSTEKCQRVILCTGKVYYDLLAEQKKTDSKVAIIRLEQLYPFPELELKATLKPYQKVSSIVWCQEEPKNQGAWQWIHSLLESNLSKQQTLQYVGRPEAASPAVGSPIRHKAEQERLVKLALTI